MSREAEVLGSIRAGGLVQPGMRVLTMLSGGADSVCLLHALRELLGPGAVTALHVNHGLRAAAAEDERFCGELCSRLGVELVVDRVTIAPGNLEARAREARYAAAERARERTESDRIATGHTASDQVETILHRLASSPGRRALLGMERASGRLIRPLLGVGRETTRGYCEEAGLAWREDETNADRSFARNRLRLDVVPALRQIHPAIEQNVLATADQLREEAEVLEASVTAAAEEVAAGGWPPAVELARLRSLPAALRRLLLRRLASEAAGGRLPLATARVAEIERLGERGGTSSLDLGQGVRVVCEYGLLRFTRPVDQAEPAPARLDVPGRCRFGDWEVMCDLEPDGGASAHAGPSDEALLDADALAEALTVRSWRHGDRMKPLGLGGTKSLQDLFTDRRVPRSLRSQLPVIESEGRIAWVAGVAISEAFKLTPKTTRAARLRARQISASSQLRCSSDT
jgi:tRNA(Ile)-lysidine synthase